MVAHCPHAANVLRDPFCLLLVSVISSCEPILSQWRAVAFVLVSHIADAKGAALYSTAIEARDRPIK